MLPPGLRFLPVGMQALEPALTLVRFFKTLGHDFAFAKFRVPPVLKYSYKGGTTPSRSLPRFDSRWTNKKSGIKPDFSSGAPSRTRTCNQVLKRHLLCQLSYGGPIQKFYEFLSGPTQA